MSYGQVMQRISRKASQSFADWLYGDWNEEKLRYFQMAYAIPGVRDYMDYLLDRRADEEYLRRYGMDYTNLHDPRKLRTTGSLSRLTSSAYHMVSRNVDSLYEDPSDKKKKKK